MKPVVTVSRKKIRGKNPQRKHWVECGKDSTGYGSWTMEYEGKKYYGFGVYLLNDFDAWLDFECATDTEKASYKRYCKARGFKYDEGEL
jgi:hypothetical protein